MPTFNQLVRKGRTMAAYKSTSPALQHGLNTLKNKSTDLPWVSAHLIGLAFSHTLLVPPMAA